MAEALRQAVRRHADAHAGQGDLVLLPIPGIGILHIEEPSAITHSLYKPVLCLVLGGAKQVSVGGATYAFAAGHSAIISADVPVEGRVVRASRADPYLALAIELEMEVIREVTATMAPVAAQEVPAARREPAVFLDETDEAVLDCALRLLRLAERPEAVPVLRPAIVRELHYWLLAGRHGAALRRLARRDGHAERISRAVSLLRAEFRNAVPVQRLAILAGMSPSSFHQHFKTVTTLSPRQFHKRLRLLEARRLMLDEGLASTSAAFAVGYESVSQFTRDYGRLFGAPPRRDVEAKRAA